MNRRLLLLLAVLPVLAHADRVVLDDTRVTGNQELPKVLYLLPWQRPGGPEGLTLPPALDHSALYQPIEPAAFRRLLRLRALVGGSAPADASTAPEED